jgi:hypothetical protein
MTRNEFRAAHRQFRTENPRKPQFDAKGMLTKGTMADFGPVRMYRANGIVQVYHTAPSDAHTKACVVMVLCFTSTSRNKGCARGALAMAKTEEFRGRMPLPV